MFTPVRLALAILAVLLILGAAAWYYLFGPPKTSAAELVPGDTLAFATIPNAARIVAGYEDSQLKSLVDAPEAKSLIDAIHRFLGDRNLGLLQDFLPELSGQSFLAVTHFDPAAPARIGLIGGFKPKPGADNFDDFVAQWRTAYPELVAQATTGAGQVEGLDYTWIRGPAATDKICVARHGGWIIVAWGEEALRDWWERFQTKAPTPSLAQGADYQRSMKRVGVDAEGILYLDLHSLATLLQAQIAKTNPSTAQNMSTHLGALGAIAVGTKFEHGAIVDRYSMLIPHDAQLAIGVPDHPCPFETMKFTGPDTRLYWAASINFQNAWNNLQADASTATAAPTTAASWVNSLQDWAQSHGLDVQRNIIAPLGEEASLQLEWANDNTYPEAGFFVKLDKPDDFKPTIKAILDTVRQTYPTTAVVDEINSAGQNFATLKFIQALPVSPTITEDGPWFGAFLTENQAARSFKRDASVGVLSNGSFQRQVGDRQKDASNLIFMDSPRLLNRGYQTALPYLSIAAMFNPTLGSLLQGHALPGDLNWLAPIDTWTFVGSHDADGFSGYSISGVGNQGIFLGGGVAGGLAALQTLGIHAPGEPVAPGISLPGGSAAAIPTPTPTAPLAPGPSTSPDTAPTPVLSSPDPTSAAPGPTDTNATDAAAPMLPVPAAALPPPAPPANVPPAPPPATNQ